MRSSLGLLVVMLALGAGWGLTMPMSKLSVSTGRLPFGILFWQLLISAATLGIVQALRRRPLPMDRNAMPVYVIIALVGTLIPSGSALLAYRHLPAGIMSILVSTVPMVVFAMALALGGDRFSWGRFGGLALGLAGVVLLTAPQGGLAAGTAGLWVLVALVAPAMYALEVIYVGHWGTRGLGPTQVMLGASLVGAALALALALVTGQFFVPLPPFGPADWAIVVGAVINAFAYTTYVWLVGHAGSTFAAQSSYLVTGFGVVWAMALLGESYSGWTWVALVAVLSGVALVQPRPRRSLSAGA